MRRKELTNPMKNTKIIRKSVRIMREIEQLKHNEQYEITKGIWNINSISVIETKIQTWKILNKYMWITYE